METVKHTEIPLEERFLGTILGAAVGDALGAPYEGWQRKDMLQVPNLLEGYRKCPGLTEGQYTDDTQLTLCITQSLIDRKYVDGADIAQKFVLLWENRTIVGAGASCTDAVRKLLRGEADWQHSGTEPGRAGNGTAMRISPIGLWAYDRPACICDDARTASSRHANDWGFVRRYHVCAGQRRVSVYERACRYYRLSG